MAKCLITGMSTQQVGGKSMYQYGTVSSYFKQALEDKGWDVDHKRFDPTARDSRAASNIKDYDAIMVGLLPVSSLGARNIYGALWSVRQAREHRIPVLFYVDDWQLSLYKSQWKTVINVPSRLTKQFLESARSDWDWAQDWAIRREMTEVLRPFAQGDWGRVLVPAFEWGDHTKLAKYVLGTNHYVDVSVYAPLHPINPVAPEARYGQWILGTLSKQSKEWAEGHMERCSWPVKTYGSARSNWASASLKEPELVQQYAESWGVIATPYAMHPGSGWWRNRYTYSAQCNAILFTDPADAARIGEAYQIPVSTIERSSIAELQEIARQQKLLYQKWEWPKERVGDAIVDALRAAWSDVNGN